MAKYKNIELDSVVNIDEWDALDEALSGSRVKNSVANPSTDELFVFKEPKPGREAQIWSELIASFIAGDLLGWPVQKALIATRKGRVGNLLGYIYDPQVDTLLHGEQLCKHVDPDFDPEVGKRHTWGLIRRIHDEFVAYSQEEGSGFRPYTSRAYNLFWARTVAFDTLISNTDRHAENWAFVLWGGDEFSDIMAPMYDNASSMGCEIDPSGLARWFDPRGQLIESKVESYVRKGRHHLRDQDRRFGFEELAVRVLKELPEFRQVFEEVANLELSSLDGVFGDMLALQGVPCEAQMTERRRLQITRLLHEGQARVIRSLEDAT